MRRTILVTVVSLIVASGPGLTELKAETPAEAQAAQVAKLEAIHVKVAAKFAALQKLTDNQNNGINTAANSLQALFRQNLGTLNQRIQEESAKTGDARDQGLIDILNAKYDKLNTLWGHYYNQDNPAYTAPFNNLQNNVYQLGQLLDPIDSLNTAWVRAGIDPAQLVAAYQALEQKIDQLTATATALNQDYLKFCADHVHAINE
jgi:hypothetical protein